MEKHRAKPYYDNKEISKDGYVYGFPYRETIIGTKTIYEKKRISRDKYKDVRKEVKMITGYACYMSLEMAPGDFIKSVRVQEDTLECRVHDDKYEGDYIEYNGEQYRILYENYAYYGAKEDKKILLSTILSAQKSNKQK